VSFESAVESVQRLTDLGDLASRWQKLRARNSDLKNFALSYCIREMFEKK
jgi:hypothetical protein